MHDCKTSSFFRALTGLHAAALTDVPLCTDPVPS